MCSQSDTTTRNPTLYHCNISILLFLLVALKPTATSALVTLFRFNIPLLRSYITHTLQMLLLSLWLPSVILWHLSSNLLVQDTKLQEKSDSGYFVQYLLSGLWHYSIVTTTLITTCNRHEWNFRVLTAHTFNTMMGSVLRVSFYTSQIMSVVYTHLIALCRPHYVRTTLAAPLSSRKTQHFDLCVPMCRNFPSDLCFSSFLCTGDPILQGQLPMFLGIANIVGV